MPFLPPNCMVHDRLFIYIADGHHIWRSFLYPPPGDTAGSLQQGPSCESKRKQDTILLSVTSQIWDGLLYYKFINQFANERIFKISEHLAKLQAMWLIVSYAPFTLHFCPQRRRIRQISKITCVIWTETVTNCCYMIGRLMPAYYHQISNCCRPVLT